MTPAELRKWRKKNNYSQSQLAKVLNIAPLTISRWERGESEMPPFLALTLASVKKRREKPPTGRPSGVRR